MHIINKRQRHRKKKIVLEYVENLILTAYDKHGLRQSSRATNNFIYSPESYRAICQAHYHLKVIISNIESC